MATAPRPTTESRDETRERRDRQRTLFAFTIAGQTYRLAPFNLPLGEQDQVERQTGRTWEDVITGVFGERVSSVRIGILIWLARRAAGEPRLSWDVFLAEWDEMDTGESVELEVVGPEDHDDPEA